MQTLPLLLALLAPAAQQATDPIPAPRMFGYGWNAVGYADLDSDGDLDAVYSSRAELVPIASSVGAFTLLNDGQANFTLGTLIPKVLPAQATTSLARLADIDGDGFADLLREYSAPQGTGIEVRFGTGSGAFGAAQLYPAPAWPLPTTFETTVAMAVGDFDGDALTELATFTNVASGTLLRFWDYSAGSFQASAPLMFSFDPVTPEPAAADIDSDGAAELAILSSGLRLFRWTPGSAPLLLTGSQVPAPMAEARRVDWDADGDLDFLNSNANPWVLAINNLNSPQANWTTATVPSPAAVTGINQPEFYLESAYDHDGDGKPELLVAPKLPGLEPAIAAVEWDSPSSTWSLNWKTQFSTTLDRVSLDPSSPYDHFDLDGDGQLERCPDNKVLLQEPPVLPEFRPLLAPGAVAPGGGSGTMDSMFSGVALPVDVEGDGDPDIVFNPNFGAGLDQQFLVNDGSGRYRFETFNFPQQTPGQVLGPEILGLADYDGDGQLDLLVGRSDGTSLALAGASILRGLPSGAFVDPVDANLTGLQSFRLEEDNALALPSGDLDGDGLSDLASPRLLLRSLGAAGFQVLEANGLSGFLWLMDVDGDGRSEVLRYVGTQLRSVDFQFQGQTYLGYSEQVLYTDTTILAPSTRARGLDIDGDGQLEIVLAVGQANPGSLGTMASRVVVLDRDLSGLWQVAWVESVWAGNATLGVASGDLDGDGKQEFVLQGAGLCTVVRSTPSGFHTQTYALGNLMVPTFSGNIVLHLADIDGDGDADQLQSSRLVLGPTQSGAAAGERLQFGQGSPGTWLAQPVLGIEGALNTSSAETNLVLTRGLGGSTGLLALGLASADIPILPGLNLYVDSIATFLPIALQGKSLAPGEGTWGTTLTSALPALAGLSFFAQALVYDAGATYGFSTTNGLKATIGL